MPRRSSGIPLPSISNTQRHALPKRREPRAATFLARAGLPRDAFVATGVAIACLIDVSRVGVYSRMIAAHGGAVDRRLLVVAVLCASAGALVGRRYLGRLTMDAGRHVIAVRLRGMAVALGVAAVLYLAVLVALGLRPRQFVRRG